MTLQPQNKSQGLKMIVGKLKKSYLGGRKGIRKIRKVLEALYCDFCIYFAHFALELYEFL
jgi:hypothetical protein